MYNDNSILNRVRSKPTAAAVIRGDSSHPQIFGIIAFYPVVNGVLVTHEFSGLPRSSKSCEPSILAMHIHTGNECVSNTVPPFESTGSHYNPNNCPHPYHAGDLPPVFNNNGYAWGAVVTNRFSVQEIIGRTIILHESVDDFTSQPSGNAGNKIGCGVIVNYGK